MDVVVVVGLDGVGTLLVVFHEVDASLDASTTGKAVPVVFSVKDAMLDGLDGGDGVPSGLDSSHAMLSCCFGLVGLYHSEATRALSIVYTGYLREG